MDGEVALVKADRVAGQYVLFDAGQIPDSAWTLHTIFAKLPATYWGGALRYHQFLAFFGLFCLFGPFRQKRRLFGRAATKTLV